MIPAHFKKGMVKQLQIFEQSPEEEEIIPEMSQGDRLSIELDLLVKGAEATNRLLTSMISRLREGWTDEQKLQINDPKEYARQQALKKPEIKTMPQCSPEAAEVLQKSKVEGMIVKLPEGQLDRKIYTEVKNSLELIGGRWKGGKVAGFVFNEDPSGLLEQIANGEKRNLKKEFQFFGTPDHLADRLVELAEVSIEHEVLEPSAGQGAIVRAIHRATHDGRQVSGYELMPVNQTFLSKITGFELLGDDFLSCAKHFDRIIANPPFAKNQDIDHISKMYDRLKPGGRLVSIAGKHWQISSNKKEKAFREWLDEVNAQIEEVDAGEFKESGTTIATVIITIDK